MRQILVLVLVLLVLTGCASQPMPTETPVSDPPIATEVRQLLLSPEGVLVCSPDRLCLLSREDLSVQAELEHPFRALAYVQVLENGISIADPESGTITLVGPDLTVTETIPCAAGENTWLVRSDGAEVYTLAIHGIDAWDLANGGSRQLLQCRFLSVLSVSSEALWLAAVVEADLLYHYYRLDLTDGTLTELEGELREALREGLHPQADGTFLRRSSRELRWYDKNGGFLGALSLPEKGGTIPTDPVWVEGHGWVLPVCGSSGCQLLRWDPVPGEGADLDLTAEQVSEGSVLPRELYDRAAALSERFGLDIRIADRAIRDYGSYDSGMLTDPELTGKALDILEEALSVYPEGFFSQLRYGNRRSVRIELVDWLKGKDGHDVSAGTSAFTVRRDQYCMIVLNAQRIRESAIFHEFSHIIDDRMAFEARLRPEALYSEEGWLALQPEGFRYADSYRDIPEEVTSFYDSGYFARNYSCVSATEDRAVTMEKAMMLEREVFEANPHLLPKLQYYCDCIRDSFDTTGWPETLPWEQLLR